MDNQNISQSSPAGPKPAGGEIYPAPPSQPTPPAKRPASRRASGRRAWLILLFGLLFGLSLLLVVSIGALAGYQSGTQTRKAVDTELSGMLLQQQYDLAVQDLAEGRYDLARQRLEYLLAQDSGYPQAADRLAEAQAILYATATPTPAPPTTTPTPTRDLRPVQDLFAQAQLAWAAQDWGTAIDTLLALRQSDPNYQTARVDGMLFMALRQRGVDKIWKQGDLEGGSYDLALAARFAPLDIQANSARELARLYMTGSAFWGVYPEEAMKYFAQVAAAAPGLHDGSGVTAAQRYNEALVQYAGQLASKGDWCAAQEQYQIAYQAIGSAELEQKLREAILHCSPPTNTPAPTKQPTETVPGQPSPSATFPAPPTWTATVPVVPPTETPPVQPPTETPAPPTEPPAPPTETSAPPTETPQPPTEPPPPPVETQTPAALPEPSLTPGGGL